MESDFSRINSKKTNRISGQASGQEHDIGIENLDDELLPQKDAPTDASRGNFMLGAGQVSEREIIDVIGTFTPEDQVAHGNGGKAEAIAAKSEEEAKRSAEEVRAYYENTIKLKQRKEKKEKNGWDLKFQNYWG